MRVIICAANRSLITGRICCGARHFDKIMRAMMINIHGVLPNEWSKHEQGFIDQQGVFLTREEAWVVARNAGQIKYNGFCTEKHEKRPITPEELTENGTLFSENLY